MPTIHVCGLHDVPTLSKSLKPSHLLSMLSGGTAMPDTPSHITTDAHLRLAFHDVSTPQDGYEHPTEDHVAQILAFTTKSWTREAPLLIHCFAGISRSTAAAFMTACALNPDVDEMVIARALRAASETATPNRLMVGYADDLLGRDGRMEEAIYAIGLGDMGYEARSFALPTF